MIEKILRFSIYNRLLVVFLTCLVVGYGVYAFKTLPIDAVPDITNQQVQINALAPGLSPYDVEKLITFPIENVLVSIPGLETTRSISRSGFAQVTAIFDDKIDIYFARQQVNEKLTEIRKLLPEEVEPTIGPLSTGLGEVYMWSVDYKHPKGIDAVIKDHEPGWQSDGSYLTEEGLKLKTLVELSSYLRTVQDWIVRPQLRTVPGIAGVDSIGGYVRQYHIFPNPQKMISYGITFSDLIDALKTNNLSAGAGYIELQDESYIVKLNNRVKNFDEIGQIVLITKDGIPIQISDVADVGIGEELRSGSASRNGKEAVVGTALMLVGANSRTVSTAVDKKIKEISKNLPNDIIINTELNRTKLVNTTIRTVFLNLSEGALLVVIILFLMLNNIRAALVTAAVIPLSMLMTAIGMFKFKISGNLMSLGALDFGLIVDGAIIITENCLRRIAERQHGLNRLLNTKERQEEVTIAAKEMIQPTVYGQAIIMIVYVPILALHGVEGKMFHPMALTVIFALISAFILSLTFVPAMISVVVARKIKEQENFMIRKLKSSYRIFLEKVIKHPIRPLIGSSILVVAALVVFLRLGSEFIPTLDENDIAMHAMRIPSTSLTQASKMQLELESTLLKQPEIAYVFSKTGTAEIATDPMPPNVSDTFIMLKSRKEWPNSKLSKNELIKNIESLVNHLPGNNYEFTQPIEMRFNELIAGTRGDLAIKIYGDDYEVLENIGMKIGHVLRKISNSEDIRLTQAQGQPTLDIEVNKEAIGRLGLRGKDVFDVIATALGGKEAGVVFEGDRRFDILIRLPQDLRNDIEALQNLPVVLSKERDHVSYPFVPLKEVANLRMVEGINEVNRENGKRVFIVQVNVRDRDLGSYVNEVKKQVDNQIKLPPGYWLGWGGQFESLESARQQLYLLVPLCFLVIFFLLFTAFHSIRHAILVFSGVPLAITGGIIALWITQTSFSISAAVGFIALSGIAVLNGLVMVTYIIQLIKQGKPKEVAIIEGAVTRLRPVLMTALVASLGFIPMALSFGTGAEVQRPLAIVVIGGLISSTLLTLIVIPAFYLKFIKHANNTKENL